MQKVSIALENGDSGMTNFKPDRSAIHKRGVKNCDRFLRTVFPRRTYTIRSTSGKPAKNQETICVGCII